jgi:hypothetical protein
MSPWAGPIPPVVKTIGAAMPERIDCVDDRSLLIADHPYFLEINVNRRQIFRDIAGVLVLVRPDSTFGSGRVGGGWRDPPTGVQRRMNYFSSSIVLVDTWG